MIQDAALRELFRTESDEHLQHLDDALLRLEQNPRDKALIEEAFRDAHSLKGAARMLGLDAVQSHAHLLEDGLNLARRGEQALSANALEAMSRQLAELRTRVGETLAADAAPPPAQALPATAQPEAPALAESGTAETATPNAAGEPGLVPFRIESVRVEPRKLDALMTQAGELTVTKTRLARRLAEVDALVDFCEDWTREEAARRTSQTQLGSAGHLSGEPAADPRATLLRLERMQAMLAALRAGQSVDSSRLERITEELENGIRLMRMLPLSNVFRLFPRLVHDLAKENGKEVDFTIEGEDTAADKRILEELKDPLMHILRNAVAHGIEPARERERAGKPLLGHIRLRASQSANSVLIEVSDDGRGLDEQAIKRAAAKRGIASEAALASMSREQIQSLIFASGLSTASFVTDVSGRGVGLDVARANVERLKGAIRLESAAGKGMSIQLELPVTLASLRVLIVQANSYAYGLPVECVLASRMVAPEDLFVLEGREALMHQGRPVPVARLAELLELRQAPREAKEQAAASPCVLLAAGGEPFGVLVDALVDEQEVVLKPQSALLERVRNVAGAAILADGEICMVLGAQDLLASMHGRSAHAEPPAKGEELQAKKVILLAEDSIVTRTQEARILESAGYEVVTATDGLEAWNRLAMRDFDAVVSDINMPHLDGLDLTERIRREAKYAELPVILVTSRASDEDKQRGLEAGANAYITKPAFDQQVLLDCLERLV